MLFHLPKSSRKFPCPQCKKRTFKPYVPVGTEDPKYAIDVNEYGRCDRQNDCGYHKVPPAEKAQGQKQFAKSDARVFIIHPSEDELKKLYRKPSNLHKALAAKGIPEEFLYDNGVLTNDKGLTAFVFYNYEGKFSNIKFFKYQENGKRDKEFKSFSLKQPEQKNEFVKEEYTVPLFGEHELKYSTKTVCVVESEKTKIIAMFHYPEYTWQACGSANGLSDGSESTADKITPLKGKKVYWVNDNDEAARGKIKTDDLGKEIFVECSSIRNGKKHLKNNFHIADLFKDKEPGYDIGDALLEGLKREIKPTWSPYQSHPLYAAYMPPTNSQNIVIQSGESSEISKEFDSTFSWMRGHVNAFYGWSNDGKGLFTDFLSVVKAKKKVWKKCMFKQEDMGSVFDGKTGKITADRIYDKLVWSYTGNIPPSFEPFAKKHSLSVMSRDEYYAAREWVIKHFFVVYPSSWKYKDIGDVFMFFHEVEGIDEFEIDPWNTVILDDGDRGDQLLIRAFIYYKEMALKTNGVFTLINHARSGFEPREKNEGAFKVVTQFMQLGGSAWDIKMDGQFSIHRPYRHKNPNDPRVHLHNLKQRDAEVVGAERGIYEKIEFDKASRQYFFDGVCPIDGRRKEPMQTEINYEPSWRPKKPKKEKEFEDHLKNQWGVQSPSQNDDLNSDDLPEWAR